MLGALLDEGIEIALVILGPFVIVWLVSRRNDQWARGFRQRRLVALLLVAAAVVLGQVLEEVLGKESGTFDWQVLELIHTHTPAVLLPAFQAITLTGSLRCIVPIAVACVALALWRGQRFDALQLALTPAVAGLVIYLAKAIVARPRPDLWSTQWYWGSSFPSGHTLSSAALATSICLWISRKHPSMRRAAIAIAFAWVLLVGLSRLVLGVHWPTDVAAAACAGLLVSAGVNGLSYLILRETDASRPR